MNSVELLQASALTQAALVRRREISSEELTRLYLSRIERLNGALHAFVDVAAEHAIRGARARDRETRRGNLPPFHGVPSAIKDLNLMRGAFMRMGSLAFKDFYSVVDDRTTAQLRRGGFVLLGKTSTSELGTLPVTEPLSHPPTRNPWDLAVTPGGSSGGAGAAVAAGMVPIAQGSDGAGSIRIPASFCGLFGLKPSRGRVLNAYGYPDEHLIYTDGPLARSVDDAAAMLDVMAGVSVGGARRRGFAPPPPRPFAELAKRPPPRLRIRFTTHTNLAPTHPEVDLAVRRIASLLASLGHEVSEAEMPEGTVEEFLPIWQHPTSQIPVHDWSLTSPTTRWLAEQGRSITEAQAILAASALGGRVLDWFEGADLLLTPTVPVAPIGIGAWRDLSPGQVLARASTVGPFTAPFNVSGQPAASLPVGLSSQGHPIGVQLVAKPLADALLLSVCRVLESMLDPLALPLGRL